LLTRRLQQPYLSHFAFSNKGSLQLAKNTRSASLDIYLPQEAIGAVISHNANIEEFHRYAQVAAGSASLTTSRLRKCLVITRQPRTVIAESPID
jgi:hypothetical protein